MSTYVIGDLQGCYAPLQHLLAHCGYDTSRDVLWFCGDLVNRGPDSLACLRFVKSLGDRAITVLGNHDLALLCVAAGQRSPTPTDTLDDILLADDRDDLIEWLRHRPILHHSQADNLTLVHAGIWPFWTLDEAMGYAGELESVLRGPDWAIFLAHMYGDTPKIWTTSLNGWDRLRFIVNAFTRMRFCAHDGSLCLEAKGSQFQGAAPWFEMAGRIEDSTILFGHWAALEGKTASDKVIALDTGCVWGNSLTAYRLEDKQRFQADCSAITCLAQEGSSLA